MTETKYMMDAQRTKSNELFPENVSLTVLIELLQHTTSALQLLDRFKKALYYNKEDAAIETKDGQVCFTDFDLKLIHEDENTAIDILHGILGIATESGELLEALLETLKNAKQLDLVNIEEELGDANWYIAVLLKALKSTFKNIWYQNIQKLRKRFPFKFSTERANKRNLKVERKNLEKHSKVIDK